MIPDPEIEGFVWPDTEDAAVDTVSTVDGGPLILYTERVERPRPLPQPQPVARIRERIRRARPAWPARRERPAHPQRPVPAELVPAEPVAPRHAAAVEMGRYALAEASRYAVAEWVRRTGAPAGRHSALPGAGWYPVVPLPMTSTYRGRRRAEVVNDWRWPAVAGTVAGASLALAILLIAASPPSHGMAGTPSAGGGGITMVGAGQFGAAPQTCTGTHPAGGACHHTEHPTGSGHGYQLTAVPATLKPKAVTPLPPAAPHAGPVAPTGPVADRPIGLAATRFPGAWDYPTTVAPAYSWAPWSAWSGPATWPAVTAWPGTTAWHAPYLAATRDTSLAAVPARSSGPRHLCASGRTAWSSWSSGWSSGAHSYRAGRHRA